MPNDLYLVLVGLRGRGCGDATLAGAGSGGLWRLPPPLAQGAGAWLGEAAVSASCGVRNALLATSQAHGLRKERPPRRRKDPRQDGELPGCGGGFERRTVGPWADSGGRLSQWSQGEQTTKKGCGGGPCLSARQAAKNSGVTAQCAEAEGVTAYGVTVPSC